MMKLFFLALLFCGLIAQDANDCLNYPTCAECIAHNLCGWCPEPVIYNDGTFGPRCAGKPQDPNNPPPGWKPWTCPKDFQNQKCYGYRCDNTTYQCVSAGPSGDGVPLQDCLKACFPPTYECNTTTHQCYQVPPGHGTDLPDCERQCMHSTTGTTGGATTGTTGTTGGRPTPQVQGYVCDNNNFTCNLSPGGGVPKDQCDASCGKPANITPIFAIGDYRGLEVDHKYVRGEWQAKITKDSIIMVDPTGKTWAKGVVRQYNNELWLVTPEGTRRGLFGLQNTAEVSVLTWAMGNVGGSVPTSFDDGLANGATFVLAKCLNPGNCKWHMFQAINKLKLSQAKWMKKFVEQEPVNDPCSKYPDCHTCISAKEWCGWCSVPVLYNNSIPGKNCAGLNTTVTPRINCTGTFSTVDCSMQTTGSTGASTAASTGGQNNKYICDPRTNTCSQSMNGTLPKDTCDAQCKMVPVVPVVLQDKYFRGLEIDMGYKQGEWRAHFNKTAVTIVTPDGKVMQGSVTTTAQYLTIHFTDKSIVQTLWQFQPGPAVDNLSWAWGAANGPAPTSFDQAMTTAGQSEYWFVTCHQGASTNVCDFSH